jgi:hypothetical protein
MSDDSNKKESNSPDAEFASKTWDVLASIGLAVIGVPLPPTVIKSLRKTADRFICGATDYGMTYVEDAISRRKSLTEGKQVVLRHSANAVAKRVANDDKLVERALDVFASELMIKQNNKEKVLKLAINELNVAETIDDSGKVIDDDWLGEFSTLASNKSNLDVQVLLAKILAGEIRKPGTFSPLTLHILSTLTPQIAKSFEIFCNLCVVWEPEIEKNMAFICHQPYPNFLHKGITEYNISYGEFMILQGYGLLSPKLDAGISFPEPVIEATIEIGGKRLRLISKTGTPINVIIQPIAPLSIPGTELRNIISLEVPAAHLQKQIEYFNNLGFEVTPQ